MFTQFQNQLSELAKPTNTILLAVSGGVDSMVMLELFLKSDYKFAVAHCNFQLRGQAEHEATLVKSICEQNHIPFHYRVFETKTEVENKNESTQMVARRLRYDFFEELMGQYGYAFLATAHHANDNLETLLLNLTKGTGIRGMVGIAEKTDKLIRPLTSIYKGRNFGLCEAT